MRGAVEQKIKNLSKYLSEINEADKCMMMKQYYLELKQNNPKRQTADQKMILAKKEMLKELKEFEL